MYLSSRTALVRNLSVSGLNGAITLIILLIAPMGLAAVIINTLLVTLASFANATLCDRIICYLQPSPHQMTPPSIVEDSSQSFLDKPHQK